ncbi:phospholipase A2 inhibitor and Ly6/PLAUR domain-containing protein-like isoform X1 [Ascaphus truei]|uniref:phospholipase A2 inhibitor and Ly6/PLAUR domain-containing protein-like isoform X1 n=1 Tax=Ascaphus truei TaxID=8439 RepID=UPI003F59862E
MRSLLQVLCVLSALVATGYSLSCTVCVSSSGSSCTGPSITCPDDNVCESSFTVLTAGGIETKIFTRNCEPQTRCGLKGSYTLPAYKTKMGSYCCATDNCTPGIPTLPADNSIKNGATCPTCTSANSDYCYTSYTIECTGDEVWCLLQSTITSGSISSTVAQRGCATATICNHGYHSASNIGNQSASSNGLTTEVIIKCSNGNIGLHPGFFFPAAALLLMKLLS